MIQDCKYLENDTLPLPKEYLFFVLQVTDEADSTSKMLLLCDFGILCQAGMTSPVRLI